MVYADRWYDTVEDPDRQRRKQAEFLVYRWCDWRLIDKIGVFNEAIKMRIEKIFQEYPQMFRPVQIHKEWYY